MGHVDTGTTGAKTLPSTIPTVTAVIVNGGPDCTRWLLWSGSGVLFPVICRSLYNDHGPRSRERDEEVVCRADLPDADAANFPPQTATAPSPDHLSANVPEAFRRDPSTFLNQKVFNSMTSETEMMRYMTRLQNKDLSLVGFVGVCPSSV